MVDAPPTESIKKPTSSSTAMEQLFGEMFEGKEQDEEVDNDLVQVMEHAKNEVT